MNSYQETIHTRRNFEASVLWGKISKDGFSTSQTVALDFVFFSEKKVDAEKLAKVLSGSYTVRIVPANDPGYWLIKGTTRPYGKKLSADDWQGWIEFMVATGFENNCVFSTWAVYDPTSKRSWSSEEIEAK